MTLQRRYLELLRKSLINELYVENDARTLYTFASIVTGKEIDARVVRNIATQGAALMAKLTTCREEGRPWWNVKFLRRDGIEQEMNLRDVCDFAHSMIGAKRMKNIEDCLDRLRDEGVPGDLMETGVCRGGAAIFMRGYLAAYEMSDRVVWAADSFEGLPPPTHPADRGFDYSASVVPSLSVSLDEVKATFAKYGLLDDQVRFLKGWFRDTLPNAPVGKLALLRLDGDLYESTMDALVALYDKVVPGGFVLVDDYGDFPPCRKAVDEFRASREIDDPVVEVDWTGVYWRKSFTPAMA